MKTVVVVFTDRPLKQSEIGRLKKYSFNTESSLKVDDVIMSNSYNNAMQVVKVLDKAYKYYNSSTGELSDEFNSTNQWEIKELVIREEKSNVVYGQIINMEGN